ncbi:unnamed protein product [Microthlaspi erraticum]|uniref:Uncharacterized protein n=1 Tax=Microthlaspi erraticum TaxID=1685480 RepID=A0A6D2HRA5_9BRAS|nr:unnamed protein product [Microthlaspi erraticum]
MSTFSLFQRLAFRPESVSHPHRRSSAIYPVMPDLRNMNFVTGSDTSGQGDGALSSLLRLELWAVSDVPRSQVDTCRNNS